MAKHKQLWLKGSKGKLAGTTFYQTAGVTIQREINYDPSNPRTDKQMTQRTKLANLVNMYRAGKSFFPRAFENKKPLESDYNKFVSYNLTNSPVHLTKGEATKGVFIPAGYMICQGSLESLPNPTNSSGVIMFDIFASSDFSQNSTVGQVSTKLISTNPQVENGDQISLVAWYGDGNSSGFFKYEFIVNTESTDVFASTLPSSLEFSTTQGLMLELDGFTAGAACVLSRTVAGKTLVSTQSLVINEDASYIAHTGDTARNAAINSYGASKKVFLDNK